MQIMAMIGNFPFSLSKTSLETLSRNKTYHFSEKQKALSYSTFQAVQRENEEISISGSTTTLRGGIEPLQNLFKVASEKKAVPLVFGYGAIYGDFIITKISENRTIYIDDGRNIKVDFTLELKRVFV